MQFREEILETTKHIGDIIIEKGRMIILTNHLKISNYSLITSKQGCLLGSSKQYEI